MKSWQLWGILTYFKPPAEPENKLEEFLLLTVATNTANSSKAKIARDAPVN